MKWLLMSGAVVSEVAASLCLKAALDNPLLFGLAAVGYTTCFVLLGAVLRRGMALGVAYGMWAALGVTLTALLAAAVFGEPLTPLMLVGIALVISGVLCVELGSHRAPAGGEPASHGAPATEDITP